MESFGIQETKEVVVLGCRLGTALSHGKVSIGDSRYIFGVISAIKPALDNFKDIPKELGDLSDAERLELDEVVAKELNIPISFVKNLGQEGFDIILRLLQYRSKITQAKSNAEQATQPPTVPIA